MADAYGMLYLNQSDDFSCDFQGLTRTLNQYRWNNSGAKWILVSEGNKTFISIDCHGYESVQYPTVHPYKLKRRFHHEYYTKPNKDQSLEEVDLDYEDEDVSFENLVYDLSKHIHSGQLEIRSVSNEKQRYHKFGRLIIRSNGTAVRKNTTIDEYSDEEFFEEITCEKARLPI